MIRIKQKEIVCPKFLYLFFQSENYWQQIRGHEVGAAQPNVNGQKLGLIKVPLPKIEIQKIIASKLDDLFQKIDKSILLLEENLQYSKSLILSILDDGFGKLDCKQVEIGQILENSCISSYGLMPNFFYLQDKNLLQHLNKRISPLE